MKHIVSILIIMFSALCIIESALADEIFVSKEEQAKRDSDKERILQAELAQELNFIGEKTQLAADAMRDSEKAQALRGEIVQHQLNVTLIKKELEPKQGGKRSAKRTGEKNRAKANSELPETKNLDWWNPYNRNHSISIH